MQPDSRGERILRPVRSRPDRGWREWLVAPLLLIAACNREDAPDRKSTEEVAMHAQVRLLSESGVLVPGSHATLGVSFTIDPGWHLYYNGQNETGYPIRVEPDFPPGFRAGDLRWPAPVRHISPGNILDHVYTERVTLLFEVSVPESARPGDRARLWVRALWMACRAECIPEEGIAELELPVAASREETGPSDPEGAAALAEARSRMPLARGEATRPLETRWEGGDLLIRAPGAQALAFYPDTASVDLVDLLGTGAAEGESLRLTPHPGDRHRLLAGVLAVTEASPSDQVYISVTEPLPAPLRKETDR